MYNYLSPSMWVNSRVVFYPVKPVGIFQDSFPLSITADTVSMAGNPRTPISVPPVFKAA